ncbi:MAG TPA: recombination mediator RecR [Anaerolineales bacterium]|nr:recombination mediator RecR [Anaerolineales bacterium]
MAGLPEPIQRVVNAFARLPGVGPKTASRLAFYLLRSSEDLGGELAEALSGLKEGIGTCALCFNIAVSGQTLCEICSDPRRDEAQICVVEDPLDVLAIERTGGYSGRYHVLGGLLSPIEGVGPDEIRAVELLQRAGAGRVQEVILATNPSMEGDATAMYLQKRLMETAVQVTRLARGLPVGGDLEYADQGTLLRALAGRQEIL